MVFYVFLEEDINDCIDDDGEVEIDIVETEKLEKMCQQLWSSSRLMQTESSSSTLRVEVKELFLQELVHTQSWQFPQLKDFLQLEHFLQLKQIHELEYLEEIGRAHV